MRDNHEIWGMIVFIIICFGLYYLYDSGLNKTQKYIIRTPETWFYSNSVKSEGDCTILDNGHICGSHTVEINPYYKGVK